MTPACRTITLEAIASAGTPITSNPSDEEHPEIAADPVQIGAERLASCAFVEAPGISAELNEQLQAAVSFFGVSTQAYLDNGVARGFLRGGLDTEITALAINSMIFEGVRHVAGAGESTAVLERWIAATATLMFEGISIRP